MAGFEPANVGSKGRCLKPLGYIPVSTKYKIMKFFQTKQTLFFKKIIRNFVTLFLNEVEMNKLDYVKNVVVEKIEQFKQQKDGENYSPIPNFKAGDIVNVAVRVIEGEKERIQNFRGIVLYRRGEGPNQTFCVRKVSNGVGVERIFPLYSPMIQSITVVQSSKVRRARLFYLRGMSERKIRQKLRVK